MPFQFQVPYTQGNDASAFNEGMQSAGGMVAQAIQNQLRQQQIQQEQIQNQYLPQMSQADIALKQAQASAEPLIATGTYLRGAGSYAAQSPQMQLTRMLMALPPALRAQQLAQHPEYASIINNQFSAVGNGTAGIGGIAQPQPQNPNLNIGYSSAPVTNTGNLQPLPMPNSGREQQMVNQGGFNQNNLTINPAQLAAAQAAYKNAAAVDYSNAAGKGFDQMPQTQKNAAIAQLTGFGMDATQATQYLRNGGTITQAAINAGYSSDPTKWPQANYAPTTSTITQLQQRQQRGAELDPMSQAITAGYGPNGRYAAHNILGYSPAFISDALSGSNPDQQAAYIAARALGAEQANIRAVLSGNPRPGIETMRELTSLALQSSKIPPSLISGPVWQKAQQIINDTIQKSAQASYNQTLGSGLPVSANKTAPTLSSAVGNALGGGQGQGAGTNNGMVRVVSKEGQIGMIPASKVNIALQRGARLA